MTRRNRSLAVMAAAVCLPFAPSGTALADSSGDTKHDLVAPAVSVKAGDTPAEFGKGVPAPALGGDTHADFGKPAPVAPTRVEIVRPERTVVHDVDEALPIVLASLAILLAMGGLGVALGRSGTRMRLGRSH